MLSLHGGGIPTPAGNAGTVCKYAQDHSKCPWGVVCKFYKGKIVSVVKHAPAEDTKKKSTSAKTDVKQKKSGEVVI